MVTVTNVPLALIFYELFKVVNRRVALLAAFFILVATAIEAGSLVNEFAPLILLGDGLAADLPAAQLEVLAALHSHLADVSYTIYTVFFGLDILCLSYLVFRSRFVPRAIAVLLALDGLAYLVYSFTDFLAPGLAAQLTPWIQLPPPVAEGAFALWLLVFGVDVEPWTRRATDDTRSRSDRGAQVS